MRGLRRSPALFLTALAALSAPAQAQAVRCEVTSAPEVPGAAAEAFSRSDVWFSAIATARCYDADDTPVAVSELCVSARREQVSGTFEFRRDAVTVPYSVRSNNVEITAQEAEIWSGSVGASGRELEVDYEVRAADFAGFPGGAYHATTVWTAHLDTLTCG